MNAFVAVVLLVLTAAVLHHRLRSASVRKWTGLAMLASGVLSWSCLPKGQYLGLDWFIAVPFLICTGSSLFFHRHRYLDTD